MKYNVPEPKNEPILNYAPDSTERVELLKAIKELKSEKLEIPMIIGGEEVKVGEKVEITSPHDHNLVLGHYYRGGEKEINDAINAAMKAKEMWSEFPWQERVGVFLRAADLISSRYRSVVNASTMLCQSKNIYQAEIDAVCELVDFFRLMLIICNRFTKCSLIARNYNGIGGKTDLVTDLFLLVLRLTSLQSQETFQQHLQ